jgi:hypothetical protein
MNSEQLEEHMMILAIQAAHHASSSQVKLKDSTVSDDSESDVDSRLDGDRGSESPRVKISAHMFLLGMHRNIFFCVHFSFFILFSRMLQSLVPIL